MDFQQFRDIAVAQAKAMGIEEYELYYECDESTSVSVFQHEINAFSCAKSGGVCFRCLVNGKMGYASTEELSQEQAQSVVLRAAENAKALEAEETQFLCPGGQVYETPELHTYDLPSTEELVSAVLGAQEQLYATDPAVVDGCQTEGITESTSLAICNSKGLDLHYENKICAMISAAVVSDGTEMSNEYAVKTGALSTIDTAALAAKSVSAAKESLGGDVAPTGICPVVFDPEAMTSLLSTFSSIFSSENTQKGLSRLGDKEGQVIASPLVTLVDDPFYKENPMPLPFDGEGSPTHRKNVIEKGVLNTLLYNLKTAAVAGKATTGNASKSGYASSVGIRPFTMYIAPGESTEEDLLKKAGNGIYINSLGGLHAGADPVSGDFSLQSAGFLIENGEKTTHVKSFTVAGNIYDLLTKITAVASNLTLPMPLGSTTFGSPSVLVETLSIAGK